MASPGKKSFLMRVDPQLWAELERLAATELRSVNGQIEYMLRESIGKRKGKAAAPQLASSKLVRIKRRAGDAG